MLLKSWATPPASPAHGFQLLGLEQLFLKSPSFQLGPLPIGNVLSRSERGGELPCGVNFMGQAREDIAHFTVVLAHNAVFDLDLGFVSCR